MGKFDGVLLVTDWDGTFYRDKLFEDNIEALRYFEDNGGAFSVCSGRYSDFLRGFKKSVPFNTYTICYNGAYIVDLDTDDVLYQGFCDEHLFDIIDGIIAAGIEYLTVNVYDDLNSEPVAFTYDEYLSAKDDLKRRNIYKVLLRAENDEKGSLGAKAVSNLELYDYIAVRSWGLSLEIMKLENSKGAAIRRLAKKLNSKIIVAVGDYENDLEMLKAADISYAVDNAIEDVKRVADRQTVSVTESAIAHVIGDIERDIDNKIIVL